MNSPEDDITFTPGQVESLRILVMDDEEAVRNLLEDFLLLNHFSVLLADNAHKAISLLETEDVDLVLSDLVMPKMDGIALTKAVREMGLQIPVIVMTGYVSIDYAVESMKAGAVDFVTKPLNFNHVLFIIQRAMETSRLQRLAQESELYRRLSHIDDMTEINNHRSFEKFLNSEIERQRRYSRPLSLLMIDIDDFKRYNDTYGHLVGDQVLRQVAALLKRSVRGCDFVARYGGEEFVVVLPETAEKEAVAVGRRILAAIGSFPFETNDAGRKEHITVTIGFASIPEHAQEQMDLIDKADKALFIGKRSGKDCLCVYGREDCLYRADLEAENGGVEKSSDKR